MSSTYPTTLDSLSTVHADGVSETIHAATVNDVADAVNKIEAELGTLPKGAAADVKTRIANTETVANAAIPKSLVTAAGDILYATGSAALTNLATSSGKFLKAGASAPAWATPAAADLSGYPSDGTKFLAGDGTWKAPSAASLTSSQTHITADVTMTSANTYYDGPSLTVAAGTWLLIGSVVLSGGTNPSFTAKLWDGTTAYDAGDFDAVTANSRIQIRVSAVVSPAGSTTYKISAASATTGGSILASPGNNATGLTNLASGLVAVKIA